MSKLKKNRDVRSNFVGSFEKKNFQSMLFVECKINQSISIESDKKLDKKLVKQIK